MYTCSICILSYLRLNYGQVSKKHRILRSGAYQRVVLIRGRRLFRSQCEWCSAYWRDVLILGAALIRGDKVFRGSYYKTMRKGVLKNFAKFTGKPLCWSIFLNKVEGLSPAILFIKRIQHRCFRINFANF